MDLCNFTLEMQSHVIISTLVGSGPSKTMLPYENPATGEIKPVLVSALVNHILEDFSGRLANPLNIIFPWMLSYRTTPSDYKFNRNILTFKHFLRELLKERSQGTQKADFQDAGDIISILLEDEHYKDDHEKIIDEVIILFIAGMKTV